MDDLAALGRLITALRPWLDELVLVGGWAHRLHRLRPEAIEPPYEALRTRDADLAFASNAALGGSIGAALKSAGFEEEFRGDDSPPVSRYHLGREDGGFYAEFLTPLRGSGIRRSGKRDDTESRSGVVAQKLRHLDVLFIVPWTILLPSGGTATSPTPIKIPNPVTFIAQKVLIRTSRAPEKQAQDILYIHDTLDLFGGSLHDLQGLWLHDIRPRLPGASIKEFERLRPGQFARVTDLIRDAALIPQDRRLEPEAIRATCELGLSVIFG